MFKIEQGTAPTAVACPKHFFPHFFPPPFHCAEAVASKQTHAHEDIQFRVLKLLQEQPHLNQRELASLRSLFERGFSLNGPALELISCLICKPRRFTRGRNSDPVFSKARIENSSKRRCGSPEFTLRLSPGQSRAIVKATRAVVGEQMLTLLACWLGGPLVSMLDETPWSTGLTRLCTRSVGQ